MVFPPLAGEKAEESLGARAAGTISRLYPECIHQEKGGREAATVWPYAEGNTRGYALAPLNRAKAGSTGFAPARWSPPGGSMRRRLEMSEHARGEALRRQIDEDTVLAVARDPEQRLAARSGREIRQSRIADPASGKLYLIRVVVEVAEAGETIVTVYRTSRISRYWRDA
jgi:hypothetical protein